MLRSVFDGVFMTFGKLVHHTMSDADLGKAALFRRNTKQPMRHVTYMRQLVKERGGGKQTNARKQQV